MPAKRREKIHVFLRPCGEYSDVSLYFNRDDGLFYYSRDGKRFSPKAGTSSLEEAEVWATEAEEKRLASKRVAPSLRFAVWAPKTGNRWGERGGAMLPVGTCSGYNLGSGKEGLIFLPDAKPDQVLTYYEKRHGREPKYLKSTYSDKVRAFVDGDPAIDRIRNLNKQIVALEEKVHGLKLMLDSDLHENGVALPDAPEDKTSRVKKEIALVEASKRIGYESRRFLYAITESKGSAYFQASFECPKKWTKITSTSAHAILKSEFTNAVWLKSFVLGVGKYEEPGSHRFRKIEDNDCVTFGFKLSTNDKTLLLIRDVTRPYIAMEKRIYKRPKKKRKKRT